MRRFHILTVEEEKPIPLTVSEQFVNRGDDFRPHYDGDYVINPAFFEQTLETADKIMDADVTVNPIEVSRTSNPSGGKTVYIGGII